MPWSEELIFTKPVFPVKASKIKFGLISYPHDTPETIGVALIGYLLGSIPFGVLVAKRFGVDIYSVGSGNPGATNVLREIGKPAGYTVFVFDFLKGFLATYWFMIPVFSIETDPVFFWGYGVCPPPFLGTLTPCLPVSGAERAWLRQWGDCSE